MTSIDFHFNTPDRLQYACRLARKITQSGSVSPQTPLVVYCSNQNRLKQFDELLWAFSEKDFIAHAPFAEPAARKSPVVLVNQDERLENHHLLLNLDDRTPAFFSRFSRLFEVVSADEEDRAMARLRFSYYRDRGYPLTRHDLAQNAQ